MRVGAGAGMGGAGSDAAARRADAHDPGGAGHRCGALPSLPGGPPGSALARFAATWLYVFGLLA